LKENRKKNALEQLSKKAAEEYSSGKAKNEEKKEPEINNEDVIFISYSRHDGIFVSRLVQDLRGVKHRVWVDLEQIPAGKNWHDEIEVGLLKASKLIFVSSANSAKSLWMISELQSFRAAGKPIIPIVIDDTGLQELPESIIDIQFVDFRYSYEKGLQLLLKALGLATVSSDREPITPKAKKVLKGYVFLSYAEEDVDFVEKLRNFLKLNRFAYWDYEESDRDYHSQLFLELEGVITESSATLSILSDNWKQSEWTIREYFFSSEINNPVFLLKAKKNECITSNSRDELY